MDFGPARLGSGRFETLVEMGRGRCRLADLARSMNANGGWHCCQPPLRRAKDMPVFVTLVPPGRSPLVPVFDPGSPAQASLPKPRSQSPGLASQKRVRRPSTALLGAITLASCFASISPRENKDRIARETNASSGALFPAGRELKPKPRIIACRRRSVLPSLPPRRVALERITRSGDWDACPDHA